MTTGRGDGGGRLLGVTMSAAINRSGLSKAVCVDGRCPRVRELPQTQNGVVAADAPIRALRKKQKVGRLRALRSLENDDLFGGAAPRSHHCSL
jgi:hypothetical protein